MTASADLAEYCLMRDRTLSTVGVFAATGVACLLFALPPIALATGLPVSSPPAARADEYLGGAKANGRVAQIYVKAAENVFLALDQAPEHLRKNAERWVEVQFPESLADDVESARAIVERGEAGVQVGDVVEIRFAHKDNPRYFPVSERTRVTAFVARKDEMLAKDFERRILARSGLGAPPHWLATNPTPVSGPSTATEVIRVDARR